MHFSQTFGRENNVFTNHSVNAGGSENLYYYKMLILIDTDKTNTTNGGYSDAKVMLLVHAS